MLPIDLILGLCLICAAAAAVFVGVARVPWNVRKRQAFSVGLLAFFGLVWFANWGRDAPWLATLLPFSNLVVVGNWLPLGLAVLAGIAWRTSPGTWWRRSVPVVGLAGLAIYSLVQPLLGQPPPCHDLWKGDVCLQSSDSTCSAACAATLLKVYGIEATESEMTQLCLTRKGTTWLGMYRGLKLKTAGTGLGVEVFTGDVEALKTIRDPILLDVGLPLNVTVPKIYSEEYGWQPGVLHSVIYYGFKPPDRAEIAEPTPGVGREEWSLTDMQVLYRGRGFRLVRRAH